MAVLALENMKIFRWMGKFVCGKEDSGVTELRNIIERRDIRVVFQPVVSLEDGAVIGYEALSRGPRGSRFERPDALFAAAAQNDLVWELEYICRTKALERAREMIGDKMLFLNVDPSIIHDHRFHKGHTQEIIRELRLNSGNIVFEITEKSAISDYASFRRILDNYISQGYKVAIDDTGAGYSGLKTLAQTRPNFIKVDMDLVRDIDKDILKQAMMEALHNFSVITGSDIIAEGIETREELDTLISIGVRYGQGYFLARPLPEFVDIPEPVKQVIIDTKWLTANPEGDDHTLLIGELARPTTNCSPETRLSRVMDLFANFSGVQGVPVVIDGQLVGLLMKNKLLARVSGSFGRAVIMNRPVSTVMERGPLAVDYATPLEAAVRLALSRKEDDLYDYILVNRDGRYHGAVAVKTVLEKMCCVTGNRLRQQPAPNNFYR